MGYNVCDEIRCPYSLKNGCDRYSVSNRCHLLYPGEPGAKREGLEPNQYWLFADETDPRLDINQLKDENAAWLKQDDRTQRLIEWGFSPFEVVEAGSPT